MGEGVKNTLKLIIVSDGTGETATGMVRAAMAQFENKEILFTRYKNVRTKKQLDHIFENAAIGHDLIVHTMVSKELRDYTFHLATFHEVVCVDFLGNILAALSSFFEEGPSVRPGALRDVNEEYFKRVLAMEFTLNHDDGVNIKSLHLADVILLGVSRTSKTPLSMYLSSHGIKVVNIPLIPNTQLPEDIFKVDQRKIFGLTIDPQVLHKIRVNRLTKIGPPTRPRDGGGSGEYTDIRRISEEVEWANEIFKKNKRWPVFNVTGKAIEETASEIIRLLGMRKQNIFKQNKINEKRS